MKNKYSEYSDDELVSILRKKWTKNKQAAFAELYSRHSRVVYAYILKMTRNKNDANDVFQEAMLSFYEYSENVEVDNVKALMMTIARNKLFNIIRKAKPIIDQNFDELLDTTGEEMDFSEVIDYKAIFKKGLSQLNDEMREVYVLKYYLNYSYEEIVTITGSNSLALRQLMYRANAKLRNYLKPYFKEYINQENEQ